MNQIKQPDKTTGDELVLYTMNDEPLYKTEQAWVKNYMRKQKRGVYDRTLALQGIINNFVPMVIQAYNKEFGLGKVDKATKEYMAEELLQHIEQDIEEINQ